MVEAAEDWLRDNLTFALHAAARRGILDQGHMCPGAIVVVGVSSGNSPEMRLAEHDEVGEALASYRADQDQSLRRVPAENAVLVAQDEDLDLKPSLRLKPCRDQAE